MWNYNQTEYLCHHGIRGQRWGVRRTPAQLGYSSTSLSARMARRKNEKVDKSFKKWNENVKKRDTAIELGKKANEIKIGIQKDPGNKNLKSDYKQANKEYKKAYRRNTLYRQGVVRKEVGQDASRKYLSEAKKIKKQLEQNPTDKNLKKKYSDLMSKHDIERAKARKAEAVGTKRMRAKSSLKRNMTLAVKGLVTTTAVAAGAYAANRYLTNHNVTLNGNDFRIDASKIAKFNNAVKTGKDFMGFVF